MGLNADHRVLSVENIPQEVPQTIQIKQLFPQEYIYEDKKVYFPDMNEDITFFST